MKCLMQNKKTSSVLFILSVIALILSGYVFFSQNEIFGLAGTQMILISMVLGIYAVYAGTCCDQCGTKNE